MSKLLKGINDLETFCKSNNRENILQEWDSVKNYPLTPDSVCYGTAKKVWWIGKCGHSYSASINKRTSDNTSCPYCSSSHAKLLKGFNDLETTNPELLKYWNYNKNKELLPSMVMKGQHIKVWWTGDCGHEWNASIYHRVQGRGCPVCRSESQTSFQEQAIYYYLSQIFYDVENRNKVILKGKELDIYIPSIKVGIEYDGVHWHQDKKKDEIKNILCINAGITLYRIRENGCPELTSNPNVHIIFCKDSSNSSVELAIKELFDKLT